VVRQTRSDDAGEASHATSIAWLKRNGNIGGLVSCPQNPRRPA
jgi:hypothetical protein